ncbi:MAG: hypothetical protein JXQ73_33855 [Phycisphaerae bacterium]|nr:hypothetical protein [Phycisphaerae bacterium]
MKRRLVANIAVACLSAVAGTGCAGPLLGPVIPLSVTDPGDFDPQWEWAECLHQLVRLGHVRYDRLAANPAKLDNLLLHLASDQGPTEPGPVRTAWMINAYNTLALRAGLEKYAAARGNADQAVAPREDEYRFQLSGQVVTLTQIRTALMAQPRHDVRILLALCPARADVLLHDQPFAGATLDRDLSSVAQAAVANPRLVQIDHIDERLRVADFIKRNQDVLVDWYSRRTGTKEATLFNALLDLADAHRRDLLNTAIGYPIVAKPPERRLNVYLSTAAD